MDRALAAIHHDRGVELLAGLVEDDIVVLVERVAADGVGPKIALDVMPIEAGAADRHHGGAVVPPVLGVGGLLQQREMPGQPVVVVEEAVADEHFALREIRTEGFDGGPRLRLQRGGRDQGRRQHSDKSCNNSCHITLPALFFLPASASAWTLAAPYGSA